MTKRLKDRRRRLSNEQVAEIRAWYESGKKGMRFYEMREKHRIGTGTMYDVIYHAGAYRNEMYGWSEREFARKRIPVSHSENGPISD